MSIFDDFFDFVGDAVDDVGDVLSDTWSAIKSNPIGAITSAVAMAYGIPPMWAGALGGGAGAAATGGNIVKGAFTGGAMGYMGSMAGAATGSLGPIAQAAAMGATSAATGAVLTGQDVMTAVKAGLILGGVSGGVAKLMTPSEAISSIPKDVMARANLSADPIAALNQEMGWTTSQSSQIAAQQAINEAKNSGSLRQTYSDMIPDDVLARAKASSNPAQTVANEMGWKMSGPQVTGIYDALNNFDASTATTTTGPVTGAQAMLNTGLVDATEASVLAQNGFTASDVSNLVKLGYSAGDLADMASVGVGPQTLTNLANGALPEATINNLLTNGVSATEIGVANQFIASKQLTPYNAEQLMDKGYDQYGIRQIAVAGNADKVLAANNAGLSNDAVIKLMNNGYDVSKVAGSISSGNITADQVNKMTSGTNWGSDLNKAMYPANKTTTGTMADAQAAQAAHPGGTITKVNGEYTYTPPGAAVAPSTPTTAGPINPANILTTNLPSLDSMWAKYDATDVFNPAANDTSRIQLNSDSFADNLLKEQYGTAANNGVIQNAGNPNTAYYKNLELAYQSGDPAGFLSGKGYSQSTVDQLMDYYDAKTYAQTQYQSQVVAEGYTPAQEAEYNNLIRIGMSPADAVNKIGTPGGLPETPTMIDKLGPGATMESPAKAINEYRNPNTDLATSAQVESGAAKFNTAANAWEVPTPQAPTTPIVPVIVPPTTVAPTQPVVQPPAPVAPPAPVVQPPAPVTPPAPVVTPPAPVVQPPAPAPVTTVSSSTRTTSDGSVYKDDQKSDGTVISTLISGPTGTGSGNNTTTIPEITITAPKEPPLTPPTTVVIPPDSSYVAPVDVTPKEPVVPTEPTVPTTPDPTLPIVPIVPPVEPKTPEEDNYRGKYTWGTAPKVNIPTGLNPGWMAPEPFYKNTTDAQSQYYWGAHPYQPGPTFNSQLHNTVPQAPATPWGATNAARAATSQEILAKMGNYYPLLGNTGPVKP